MTVPAAVSAAAVGLGCSTTKPSPAVDQLAKRVGRTAPHSTATIGIASTVLAVTLAAAAVWAFGKPPPQPELIGSATAPVPHLRATDPALLFTEMVPKPGEPGSHALRLTRATFRGGKLTNREEMHRAGSSDFSPYDRHWIIGSRYVVSESAVIYDLSDKKLIYSFFGGKVAAVEGHAVYFHSLNVNRPEGLFRFDATTGVVEKVSDPGAGRWGLTGAVCPNGTKAISGKMNAGVAVRSGGEYQRTLVLDRVGKKSEVLEGTFAATFGATGGGSFSFTPPGVWLDNDRFLTQTTLGKVVILNTAEKKQEKVVDITLTHKPGEKAWDTIGASGFTPLGLQQPRFSLLPDGRVVYEADVVYFIDVTKKTWEKAAWRPLGHGFEYSAVPDKIEDVNRDFKTVTVTLRHNGKEIGKSESVWWTTAEKPRVVVTDGHLALIERGLQPGKGVRADSVKVWSAATGEWQTLDVWANSVVGWVK